MNIEKHIPLLEDILEQWKNHIGNDYQAYKNHVYRVVHFSLAIQSLKGQPATEEQREKIIIAACFHDLGIWTDHTVDYLAPSEVLAEQYLKERDLDAWSKEVTLMIDMHHKFRQYKDPTYPLVEVFRRADLVDVSLGTVKWGLSKDTIKQVRGTFPNAGFHKRLGQLTVSQLKKDPLHPLPMMKW